MSSQEFVNRVLGILQVRKLTRACRADLAAGGGQALGNAVITERALLGGVGSGIDKAAAVRAGLHAIATSEAVTLVDQDDPVRTNEGCADRAHLRTRRIGAVIAELGNKEILAARVLIRRETLFATLG